MNSISKVIHAVLLVGAATVWLAAPAISHAEETEPARDVTVLTQVFAPTERRAVTRTRDGNVNTYTTFAPDEPYSCAWPKEAGVRGISVKWYTPPDSVILVQTGANGEELSRETIEQSIYNDFFPLLESACGFSVFAADGMRIAELALYTAGELPDGVYDWQPPLLKADLLVVSAHCDDELLFFGGTIPYYAGEQGLAVQVAYMANGDRARVDEALNGLWHCGVRNAPVFLPLPDAYTDTLRDALIRWNEQTTVDLLVSLIRRFRPEVIVTHDPNGEYGHGAHMASAYYMQIAVPFAADEALYPGSETRYGAWQTQKLYLHLYPENAITMDWTIPLESFGGKTALQVANEAYHMHVSQLGYHRNVFGSGEYSSARYGLAFSAVGADEAKDDFFEHVDPARLTTYIPPAPEETPAPSAMPTPAAAPTATPAETAAPAEEPRQSKTTSPLLIGAAATISLAAALVGTYAIIRRKKK